MKIVVFGANGRVGQLLVRRLLADGHTVRAFVHGTATLQHERLEIVVGDIYDVATVRSAVEGVDAVMSTLGSWGTARKDVLTAGMRSIIPAMHDYGVRRIVTLTGADARARGDDLSMLHRCMHLFLGVFAGKIVRDGERHMQLLAASNLAWTTLRSPVMNDSGTSDYRLTDVRPLPWLTIQRRAVANAMADELSAEQWLQRAPYIRR